MTINRERLWYRYREFARIDFSSYDDQSFKDFVDQINAIDRTTAAAEAMGKWRNFIILVDHDYDGLIDGIVVQGEQLESDEEYAVRIAKAEKYEAKKKQTADEKKKAAELREYKQYLKLKEKFDNVSE